MSENFSKGIQKVLEFSKSEVRRLDIPCVSPEHLFLGIIKDKDGTGIPEFVIGNQNIFNTLID